MPGKTFISYTRSDQVFARRLYDDLRSAGIDVWLDQNDIKPGEPWDESVVAALKKSTAVIVILTPVSVASRSVLDEISFALGENKRVVPVLLRDCEIPFRIARLHYTDFQTHHASALKHLISTLLFPISGFADQEPNHDPVTPNPPPGFPQPSSPKSPWTITRQKALYGFAVVAIAILATSVYLMRKGNRDVFIPNEDPSYDDPQFVDCRGNKKCVANKAQADSLQAVKDWKVQLVASPLLENCMRYPPCVERKSHADKLREVKDWKMQLSDSPLLKDCMGYKPCAERKEYANRLQEVKDWKAQLIDSSLLKDCMSYKPCVERREYADSVLSVKDWNKLSHASSLLKDCMGYEPCLAAAKSARTVQTSSPSQQHQPPRTCGPFTLENLPDCCANLGNCARACREWKSAVTRNIPDNCIDR
jgi:hypothetical protein